MSTAGPEIALGEGPDETEVVAVRDRFRVIGHSRTGRDFVVEGSRRDPESWTTYCVPRGAGYCSAEGEWE